MSCSRCGRSREQARTVLCSMPFGWAPGFRYEAIYCEGSAVEGGSTDAEGWYVTYLRSPALARASHQELQRRGRGDPRRVETARAGSGLPRTHHSASARRPLGQRPAHLACPKLTENDQLVLSKRKSAVSQLSGRAARNTNGHANAYIRSRQVGHRHSAADRDDSGRCQTEWPVAFRAVPSTECGAHTCPQKWQ